MHQLQNSNLQESPDKEICDTQDNITINQTKVRQSRTSSRTRLKQRKIERELLQSRCSQKIYGKTLYQLSDITPSYSNLRGQMQPYLRDESKYSINQEKIKQEQQSLKLINIRRQLLRQQLRASLHTRQQCTQELEKKSGVIKIKKWNSATRYKPSQRIEILSRARPAYIQLEDFNNSGFRAQKTDQQNYSSLRLNLTGIPQIQRTRVKLRKLSEDISSFEDRLRMNKSNFKTFSGADLITHEFMFPKHEKPLIK